jgi:hypothetical protein
MSRLESVHIEAFRALHGVKLEGLDRMTLLVGGNNAGKSSVLEAIGLVARPFDPAQWVQTVTNRDASASVPAGIWSTFPGSRAMALGVGAASSLPLEIHAKLGEESRKLTATATAEVQQWTDPARTTGEPEIEAKVGVHAVVETETSPRYEHTMDFHSDRARIAVGAGVTLMRAFTVTPITHRSTQQIIVHLRYALDAGEKSRCLELLRMFDKGVADVFVSRSIDRDTIRLEHEKNGVVDLSTFGDGMRRAFAMSLALIRASGGLLLVDEIESAIYGRGLSSVLPWLVRAAEAMDVQIVATTHSMEAIDAVLGAFAGSETGVVSYYLRRTETGHVCSRRDLDELRSFREDGLDIR